jgi:hypothetical protein
VREKTRTSIIASSAGVESGVRVGVGVRLRVGVADRVGVRLGGGVLDGVTDGKAAVKLRVGVCEGGAGDGDRVGVVVDVWPGV